MENIDVLHGLPIFKKSIRTQQNMHITTTTVTIALSLVTHRARQNLVVIIQNMPLKNRQLMKNPYRVLKFVQS